MGLRVIHLATYDAPPAEAGSEIFVTGYCAIASCAMGSMKLSLRRGPRNVNEDRIYHI